MLQLYFLFQNRHVMNSLKVVLIYSVSVYSSMVQELKCLKDFSLVELVT